jgi:hypothetical protein
MPLVVGIRRLGMRGAETAGRVPGKGIGGCLAGTGQVRGRAVPAVSERGGGRVAAVPVPIARSEGPWVVVGSGDPVPVPIARAVEAKSVR